ncbi:MAG: TRAP transporter small permease [Proteobacteria bacterium]|nr:TRAP transporter small permease [Pseudomonadota bacterium]
MGVLDKVSQVLNQALIWMAGVFLVAMIFLTCTNILLRLVWVPVRGTFELMGYLGAIVTAFALGYTQMKRGHIAVDILVQRFSRRTQKVLNGINHFICMIFFSIAAWQIAKYGMTLWRTGEVTETLRIIYYPFTFGVVVGCATLSVAFLTDFLKSVLAVKDSEQ